MQFGQHRIRASRSHPCDFFFRKSGHLDASNLPIKKPLPLENLRHIFQNPRLPDFGLLGPGKMINLGSLPSQRQCVKGSLQVRKFIQHGLQFFRNLQIRSLS